MSSPRPLPSYAKAPPSLIGGLPCLDFVNTVRWRGDPAARWERLSDYGELVHWAAGAGLLARGEARRLLAEARRDPLAAEQVRNGALALREALARLFAEPAAPSPGDVALINETLSQAPARDALAARDGGFAWAASAPGTPLRRPLWPVLWSAADLLTSDRLARVRRCGDPRCGWLFLDSSRNGSRRWCDMADCGNRAKAKRHYARRVQWPAA